MEASPAVRRILRVEGILVLLAALIAYHRMGLSSWHFAFGFLMPDLSMLGYLFGNRFGRRCYNLAHTYALPLLLGIFAVSLAGGVLWMTGSLVWIAHIGFDRALGYGLKMGTDFHETHLGRIGRKPRR